MNSKLEEGSIIKRIIGAVTALLVMFFTVKWILSHKGQYDWLSKGQLAGISYIIGCAGILVLSAAIFFMKKRLKTEKIFLILYLILGLSYMAVTPLSSVPDETEHMLRSYGITIGDFIPPVNENGEGGSYVPSNLTYQWDRSGARLQYMKNNLFMPADEEKVFAVYSNTAFYSPLTYLPQALGMFITRLVCNRPYVIAYVGRLCEFITSGILIYLAIKLMPFGKNILAVLSLLPMNMYECASLSGDGMAYAITLLIIAFCLWLRYEKTDRMSRTQMACLYILLALVASCKIVYAPFVFMAFIVPVERFKDKKNRTFHIVCAAAVVFFLAVVWPICIGSRYLLEYTEGVSASGQLKYVLTNIPAFIQVMMYTIIEEGEWLFKTYFGASLSYFSVECNILMVFISAASLIYVCFNEKVFGFEDEKSLKVWERPTAILFVATVLSTVFTFLSLYLEWTAVGAPTVKGLQGRYFIPLTFQAVYLMKRKYDRPDPNDPESKDGDATMSLPLYLMCMANLMVIVTLLVNYG